MKLKKPFRCDVEAAFLAFILRGPFLAYVVGNFSCRVSLSRQLKLQTT
jgi:hypothetical protein